MTISVTPKFTLEIEDDDLAEAAGQVTPTRWNDGSEITMSSGKVIGRTTAGDGPAEEITLGTAASKDTGTSSGNVPVLDGSGKLDTSILPALAISEVSVVASQSAMLALTAQKGDIAIRSDLNKSFILSTNSPSTLSDWKELLTPTDAVLSVAGLTGAISGSGLKTALTIAVADITDASANGRSLISAANYAAMKALLDLEIGTDVQAYNARLADVAGLSVTKGNVIVGNGTHFVALGVGSNGQILTADSSATNGVAFKSPAGGTDYRLLATNTISGTPSTVSFTGIDVEDIMVVCKSLTASGSTTLRLALSTNNGSSYAANFAVSAPNVLGTSVHYFNVYATGLKSGNLFIGQSSDPLDINQSGNPVSVLSSVMNAQVNAVQIKPTSGTFTAGTVELWGR